MANDYQFTFTDPTKSDFVVKPYTFNGHQTPADPAFYSNTGTTAVSANTSLVFLGKGMPDYGEAVQNNLVFLMENFANSVPPLEPKEGQLWYKNVDLADAPNPEKKGMYVYNETTTSWDKLLVETSAGVTGDLNMGGFNITNLGTPTAAGDAASMAYVDGEISTHSLDTALHLTTTQNALLDGLSPTLTTAHLNFVEGTTSSVQTQLDGKVSKAGDVMTGELSMGSNKITSLAAPTNPDDAVTKDYVDSALVIAGADGVVNSGTIDPITGVLTLGRTVGTPVVVSGACATPTHTHVDSSITHDLSAPVSMSWLAGIGLESGQYPQMPLYNLLAFIDQQLYDMQRHTHRQIIQTAGETLLTLNPSMAYQVNENNLQVFLNGIKQIASERGSSKIVCTGDNIGLTTDTGLLPSTAYTFDITVDGAGPTTITITTPAGVTKVADLVSLIALELVLAGVGASINADQYFGYLKLSFSSHTAGTGSSVSVSFGPTELFQSIVGTPLALPPNPIVVSAPASTSITTDYAYEEVGEPNDSSEQILFNTALPIGGILEVLSL